MYINIRMDENECKIKASFGEKMSYSPYFVTNSWTPSGVKDIIEMFFESTLETAIKRVITRFKREIQNGERVAIVTGDGQVIELTIVLKEENLLTYIN